MPVHGLTPITVPGVPAAWAELARKFGKLPLKESLEPAIRYAEEGYPLTPILGKYWKIAYKKYRTSFTTEEFDAWFKHSHQTAVHQKSVNYGNHQITPQHFVPLANQMQNPSTKGNSPTKSMHSCNNTAATYENQILEKYQARMGRTRFNKLPRLRRSRNSAEWPRHDRTHGTQYFRGNEPSQMPHDTQTLHEQIEAMKLAFTDGQAFITEPNDMPIETEHLLSKEYAQQRAAKITDNSNNSRTIRTTKRRHRLPRNCRRGREYGVIHPIKLHGLRLRHRHSGYRHRAPKPRRRFLTRSDSSKCTKTRKTNISHNHPRLPNKRRTSSRPVRRHGRIYAAARPFPSRHQHN